MARNSGLPRERNNLLKNLFFELVFGSSWAESGDGNGVVLFWEENLRHINKSSHVNSICQP
jgi:hypothetical protein